MSRSLPLPVLMWLLLSACAPDDVTDRVRDTGATGRDSDADTDSDTDTDTEPGAQSIVGNWVSSGADLAPVLAGDPFNYVAIHAVFSSDASYSVEATDSDGQNGTLRGSYATSTATVPGTITLTQSTPYTATAEGIWQVDGSKLTYEVVQTDPDYGFTAPSPAAGFGSTLGDGLNAGDNVQIYRSE